MFLVSWQESCSHPQSLIQTHFKKQTHSYKNQSANGNQNKHMSTVAAAAARCLPTHNPALLSQSWLSAPARLHRCLPMLCMYKDLGARGRKTKVRPVSGLHCRLRQSSNSTCDIPAFLQRQLVIVVAAAAAALLLLLCCCCCSGWCYCWYCCRC